MKRVVFGIGAVVILLLPILFVVYTKWDAIQEALFKSKFTSRRTVSPQFIAETNTPGATIAIVDTVSERRTVNTSL